jgi:hypothetical protein
MAEEEQVMEVPLAIPRTLYMVLLVAGLGFYFIWSALFDAWTDLGVYTISAILVGFGLLGTLLYGIRARQEAEQ